MEQEIDIFKEARLKQEVKTLALNALKEPLKGFCKYAFIKGNTLFYCFSSNLHKNEFDLQKEEILNQLRLFYRARIKEYKKAGIIFRNVEATISRKEPKIEQESKASPIVEKAIGEFKVTQKNAKIKKCFEDIKRIIRNSKNAI